MTLRVEADDRPNGRIVAVAGATGLVGRALVARLCADPSVQTVHALVRRQVDFTQPQVQTQVVDFQRLPSLPKLDEVYLALGTTIKQAGSQARFREVDFDANLSVAQAALTAGTTRIGLVSAMGANATSRIFYNRVKGELEQALSRLSFDALVIARPALLLGERAALGQPTRGGEHFAARLDRWLRPLIPAPYRAIAATDVATALATAVPRAHGTQILRSDGMQGAATRPLSG